jgi:hypothetical protein
MDTQSHNGLTIAFICNEEPCGKTRNTFINYHKSVKLMDGLNINISKGKTIPNHSIEEDEDEQIRLAMEQIRQAKAKKAQREANEKIEQFRTARETVIQNQIQSLQFKIEELQKEVGKVRRGERDAELTAGMIAQASAIQLTSAVARPEGEKRERTVITRPPLVGLIKSPSLFRFTNKGKIYFCKTENGGSFKDQETGEDFRSLASWTVDVIERGGGGGRKVSAYEVCEVKINASGVWKKWGDIYTPDTVEIN